MLLAASGKSFGTEEKYQLEFYRKCKRNNKGTFENRIATLAEDAKHNTQWRMQYMEWERQRTYDREAGREEGLKTGLELGREEVVRNLLANGMDPELVAKSSGIDMQKVLELKEALLAEPVN